ncbi:MAG: hypothetical protein AB1490_25555 [Pseudomonadota bacterium]
MNPPSITPEQFQGFIIGGVIGAAIALTVYVTWPAARSRWQWWVPYVIVLLAGAGQIIAHLIELGH